MVTDRDPGTADGTGTLEVTIVDDQPVVTAGTAEPTLTVDESDFATDASADFSGLFDISYGADGQDTDASGFSLTINNTDSGLIDTATDQAVVLSQTTEGVVEGRTEDSGELVFTLTLSDSGEIILDQARAVKHGDGDDANDSVTLAEGALALTHVAADSDGDEDSLSVDISERLIFSDDGPSVTVGTADFIPGTLQTQDADTVTARQPPALRTQGPSR